MYVLLVMFRDTDRQTEKKTQIQKKKNTKAQRSEKRQSLKLYFW